MNPPLTNSHAADPALVESFRQALADWQKLFAEAARRCIANHPDRLQQEPEAFRQRLEELGRGLLVKVFVEIAQGDRRWCEAEYVLAQEVLAHCWAARPERGRLREVLQEVARTSGSLSWDVLVRPFAEFPVLRKQVGELQTLVVRVANIAAKIDGQVRPEEIERLKWIESELDRCLVPIPIEVSDDDEMRPVAVRCDQAAQQSVGKGNGQAATERRGPVDPAARKRNLEAALAELHAMIGLDSIKRDVQELVNFLKVQEERGRHGLPRTSVSLHMTFCGNPGTGKTTVARIIGRILGGLGILSRGHLVETDRSGLVAKYAGQTGPKTHQKIDEALDGVLFIDEAYSLVAERGDDPYGDEALQALLKRAEDDRQRLVVVLAGYPQPMEQLLAANPGLASRFSRRLDFADYSAAELGRIFHGLCQQNHYVLPAATRLKLLLGFQHSLDRRDESFGNGRLARNVFEQAIRRLANRIADIVPITAELLTTLEPADILFPEALEGACEDLDNSARRLSTACVGCGRRVRFRPAMLGQRVKCKECQHDFQLDWGELAADG